MAYVNAGCIGYLLALVTQALAERRYGFAGLSVMAIGINVLALVI